MLAAFDRIVAGGRPELVLVSGYSGMGKSAVINELHKALVPPRGLSPPASSINTSATSLRDAGASASGHARPLLGKSDAQLAGWRDALMDALDPNG